MAKKPTTTTTTMLIELPPIRLEEHKLFLIGSSPLIVHAFPEKARKMMLNKQMMVAKGGRDARNPHEEFEAAQYILPDGRHGFPAIGFKSAAVTACTSIADITKTAARQAFRVKGISMNASGVLIDSFVRTSLVPIVSGPPAMREDVARLSGIGRTPEMRYRPEYDPWGVVLDVVLNVQLLSISQLGTMFQAAGHGVGVGDYRPERDGDCGTFDVVSEKDFLAWMKENDLTQ